MAAEEAVRKGMPELLRQNGSCVPRSQRMPYETCEGLPQML